MSSSFPQRDAIQFPRKFTEVSRGPVETRDPRLIVRPSVCLSVRNYMLRQVLGPYYLLLYRYTRKMSTRKTAKTNGSHFTSFRRWFSAGKEKKNRPIENLFPMGFSCMAV
jgi:hypothetical protein